MEEELENYLQSLMEQSRENNKVAFYGSNAYRIDLEKEPNLKSDFDIAINITSSSAIKILNYIVKLETTKGIDISSGVSVNPEMLYLDSFLNIHLDINNKTYNIVIGTPELIYSIKKTHEEMLEKVKVDDEYLENKEKRVEAFQEILYNHLGVSKENLFLKVSKEIKINNAFKYLIDLFEKIKPEKNSLFKYRMILTSMVINILKTQNILKKQNIFKTQKIFKTIETLFNPKDVLKILQNNKKYFRYVIRDFNKELDDKIINKHFEVFSKTNIEGLSFEECNDFLVKTSKSIYRENAQKYFKQQYNKVNSLENYFNKNIKPLLELKTFPTDYQNAIIFNFIEKNVPISDKGFDNYFDYIHISHHYLVKNNANNFNLFKSNLEKTVFNDDTDYFVKHFKNSIKSKSQMQEEIKQDILNLIEGDKKSFNILMGKKIKLKVGDKKLKVKLEFEFVGENYKLKFKDSVDNLSDLADNLTKEVVELIDLDDYYKKFGITTTSIENKQNDEILNDNVLEQHT